jgi:uncharacterized protein (DUF4415 family)/uncharacterized DUF497 family protein
MRSKLIWDEVKRRSNIQKHGFDFADAREVLSSRFRMDVPVVRDGETRIQSFSYALGFLAVLTVVHTEREGARALSATGLQAIKNERCMMSGSKTNAMSRKEVLAAVRAITREKDFVWDGKDEDERPATVEELNSAMDSYRAKRGRPAGSGTKEQVAIRLDHDVLIAFRASGAGWQTRMNAALRDWLKTHSPV